MIEVLNISKSFPLGRKQRRQRIDSATEVRAVSEVSFTCRPGRVFSLLGPNGAGKTTTLRMIATILRPGSGQIRVQGLDVEEDRLEVRRRLGFLTGSTGLYQRLSPDELLRYFARLYRVDKTAFKHRQDQLYDLLGIGEFRAKKIGQLSTGMKQKVSIARTMIHDPEVVVFDEPTSGLDVITAESIIALIRQCREDGKTVIFSSHIMSEVELLCDDLAIIHRGKLIFQDTMERFRAQMQQPGLTRAFIRVVEEAEQAS